VLVAVVVFVAVFIHSFVGFGFALIVTPLLVSLIGLQAAVPLVSAIGIVLQLLLLIIYRSLIDFRTVFWLCAGAVPGIPLGMAALHVFYESIALPALGLVTLLYVALSASQWSWSISERPGVACLFGLGAGGLSGAFNAPGPVTIVYGRGRDWSPGEFKSNLQGFFFFNAVITLGARFIGGDLTPGTWQNLGTALPAIVLGVALGSALGGRVSPKVFDKFVLALLAVMCARLVLG